MDSATGGDERAVTVAQLAEGGVDGGVGGLSDDPGDVGVDDAVDELDLFAPTPGGPAAATTKTVRVPSTTGASDLTGERVALMVEQEAVGIQLTRRRASSQVVPPGVRPARRTS